MKNILHKMLMSALMLSALTAAHAFDFTAENPEGIMLKFSTLGVENDAAPEAEITGFAKKPESRLETLTLPGQITYEGVTYTVTSVGRAAFIDCEVGILTLEEGIKTLESQSFANAGITSVTIPNTVTSLLNNCLSYLRAETITIPASVTYIAPDAFLHSGLKSFVVEGENENYRAFNGLLYNSNFTTLIYCPDKYEENIQIPSSVTEIADYAFYEHKDLKTVILPQSLVKIGDWSFCRSGITELTIPDTVVDMGYSSVADCLSLKKLHIGTGVTQSFSLMYCLNLMDLTISEDNTQFCTDGYAVFDKEKTTLYCILDSYTGDYEIPNTVENVAIGNANAKGRLLQSLTIPESVKEIRQWSYLDGTVRINNPEPQPIKIDDGLFYDTAGIIVPKESVDKYKTAWPAYAKQISSDEYIMAIHRSEPLSTKTVVNVPVSLKNVEDIIGFQCDIHLPVSSDLALDENGQYKLILSDRANKTHIITAGNPADASVVYETEKVVRIVCASMNNSIIKGNDGILFYLPIHLNYLGFNNFIGHYNYGRVYIDNIHLSKKGNARVDLPPTGLYFEEIEHIPGDVDEDKAITVNDATSAIAHMVGKTPDKFSLGAVDFDKDGVVLINDVTTLIDMILAQDDNDSEAPEAAPQLRAGEEDSADTMTVADISGIQGSEAELVISLDNEEKIIGFQCDITLPEGVTIESTDDIYDFSLSASRTVNHMVSSKKLTNKPNTYRVVAVSLSNAAFKGNSGELLTCPVKLGASVGDHDITLSKVILSSEGNKRIDLPNFSAQMTIKDVPTGVDSVTDGERADTPVYFDLHGRRVEASAAGIYVTKGRKVLIK